MSETVFRTPTEKTVDTLPSGKDAPTQPVTNVEPPYLDYEAQNSKPYTVEYFQLGDNWADKVGGFSTELSTNSTRQRQKACRRFVETDERGERLCW